MTDHGDAHRRGKGGGGEEYGVGAQQPVEVEERGVGHGGSGGRGSAMEEVAAWEGTRCCCSCSSSLFVSCWSCCVRKRKRKEEREKKEEKEGEKEKEEKNLEIFSYLKIFGRKIINVNL
jgi:hypothetical protein